MYELPLFPLNTVLFPGMPLNLVIFEDRYKEMLQRVLKSNQTFGVVLIKQGQEALGPLPEPYQIGCTARIIQVEPHADGTIHLTVVGDERFRIVQHAAVDSYLTGFVEGLPLERPVSLEVAKGSHSLRLRVAQYLGLLARFTQAGGPAEESSDDLSEPQKMNLDVEQTAIQLPDDPLMLIYLAAALLQIPSTEKQPLLEAKTAADLLAHMQRLYRRELAVLPPLMGVNDETAALLAQAN